MMPAVTRPAKDRRSWGKRRREPSLPRPRKVNPPILPYGRQKKPKHPCFQKKPKHPRSTGTEICKFAWCFYWYQKYINLRDVSTGILLGTCQLRHQIDEPSLPFRIKRDYYYILIGDFNYHCYILYNINIFLKMR
jgi:hypothetical protein